MTGRSKKAKKDKEARTKTSLETSCAVFVPVYRLNDQPFEGSGVRGSNSLRYAVRIDPLTGGRVASTQL